MSIPKDGYYIADVQLDTGGTVPEYVHVNLGKPHDEWGEELLPEACSNFREVDTTLMVRVWPQNAAMELDSLRKAMATLRETLRITDGRECLEEVSQMRSDLDRILEMNGVTDGLYCVDYVQGLKRKAELFEKDIWISNALFRLLAEHNVPIGSPELIAAKECGEAEMQALRTANAGLVEKVKRLEDAGDMVASHCDNQLALHEWITAKGQP